MADAQIAHNPHSPEQAKKNLSRLQQRRLRYPGKAEQVHGVDFEVRRSRIQLQQQPRGDGASFIYTSFLFADFLAMVLDLSSRTAALGRLG